jgi:oligosaccharide repeat unit polymerase
VGRWIVASLIGLAIVALALLGWGTLGGSSAAVDSGLALLLWTNAVGMVAALVVEIRRRPFSLHLMHLLGLFLFLGVSSLFQLAIGRFAVAGPVDNIRSELTSAAFAVSLWTLGYLCTYELSSRLRGQPRDAVSRFFTRPVAESRVIWLHVLGLFVLAYLGTIGLLGLSTRGAAEEVLIDYANQTAAGSGLALGFKLVNEYILRGFPLVVMVAGLLLFPRARGNSRIVLGALLSLILLGNLLANNPLAASRMWLVTAAFGGAVPVLLRRFRTSWLVVALTLGGLAVLPALHESRSALTLSEWLSFARISSPIRYLATSADGDNLGMIALAARWVERNGHTFGLQTLGAVSFWIPRRWWPGKPIGTGAMVTGDLGYGFTGWSMPIVAEGYVDFSYGGVLLLSVLFGWVLARGDRIYWRPATGDDRIRVIDVVYPLWLGCVVFFTRGDLIAASSHTSPFVLWALAFGLGAPRRLARGAGSLAVRAGASPRA